MLVRRRNPLHSIRPAGFPDPGFWQGRKVLLTGHTGFKGSWMLEWLEAMGAEVTGLALAPEGHQWRNHRCCCVRGAGRAVHG